MSFQRARKMEIGAFHQRQLQEEFVVESFSRHLPSVGGQLPEYLTVLNELKYGNSIKRDFIRTFRRNSKSISKIAGQVQLRGLSEQLAQAAEQEAQQQQKSLSLLKQIRQKQNSLKGLREQVLCLQQKKLAHERQEEKLKEIHEMAQQQKNIAGRQYSRSRLEISRTENMQHVFVHQLRQVSTITKMALTKSKKRLFSQLNRKKRVDQKLKGFEEVQRLDHAHELRRLKTVQSKNTAAYLSEVIASLYQFITSQDTIALFQLPDSLGTQNIQRNSHEIYVKLLNHRKVSLKNLETIRNRRLQRRVSSISDEPSMEVITALIVEAYVDICKRLEHLQQIYDEGLEWLKFNRQVLTTLQHTAYNSPEQSIQFSCQCELDSHDSPNRTELLRFRSKTMRNIRLCMQILKGLAEINRKSLLLEADPFFRELSLAIFANRYKKGFFEYLPSSVMNLLKTIMKPCDRSIMLGSNRLENDSMHSSSMNFLAVEGETKKEASKASSRRHRFKSAAVSEESYTEDVTQNQQQSPMKLPNIVASRQPCRSDFIRNMNRDYVQLLRQTMKVEKSHSFNTRLFRKKFPSHVVPESIFITQQRRDQVRFGSHVLRKRREKASEAKYRRMNSLFSHTTTSPQTRREHTVNNIYPRSVNKWDSKEDLMNDSRAIKTCFRSYQVLL